jgi:hypothetical protein
MVKFISGFVLTLLLRREPKYAAAGGHNAVNFAAFKRPAAAAVYVSERVSESACLQRLEG